MNNVSAAVPRVTNALEPERRRGPSPLAPESRVWMALGWAPPASVAQSLVGALPTGRAVNGRGGDRLAGTHLGAFSLTRQAMQLGYCPRMEVVHTSAEEMGQIYMPGLNMMLLIGVVLVVLGFRTSSALAAAYGIAVTATMALLESLKGEHPPLRVPGTVDHPDIRTDAPTGLC
jgi:hypothetical protein